MVRSQEFNLIENPRLFFLALAAITEGDMERFGYKPMIRPLPTLVSSTVGPPMHLDGWEIHIDQGIDADNIMVPGVVKMKITGDLLYVQPGIVGRGTSVMPVTVIPGHEFAGLEAGKKLVVKFSWPAASRVDSEDGLVRRICKRIGAKEARHITPMRFSTMLEGARLGLPRMADSPKKLIGSVEERVLRVIVCDRLRPLKDLETLPDFQSVFLDLVRGTVFLQFSSSVALAYTNSASRRLQTGPRRPSRPQHQQRHVRRDARGQAVRCAYRLGPRDRRRLKGRR